MHFQSSENISAELQQFADKNSVHGEGMKKILVVYYSRTGIIRRTAETLREILNCDILEISDLKKRDGLLGNILAGIDSLLRRKTFISMTAHDPSDYDLVITGTPVWQGNISPAIRTYIDIEKKRLPETAFFCCFEGKENIRVWEKFCKITASCKDCAFLSVREDSTKGNILKKAYAFTEILLT